MNAYVACVAKSSEEATCLAGGSSFGTKKKIGSGGTVDADANECVEPCAASTHRNHFDQVAQGFDTGA